MGGEQTSLRAVEVRPIRPDEAARWDLLVRERHYLGLGQLVGESLKYVAVVDGQWVALLGWASAAYKCGGASQNCGARRHPFFPISAHPA